MPRPSTTLAWPVRLGATVKTGSDIAKEALALGPNAWREEWALKLVMEGHTPSWMNTTTEVVIHNADTRVAIEVAPEYVCLGTDDDYLVWPVTMVTAQRIADAVGGVLPTKALVDAIYKAAPRKLAARPWTPPNGAARGANMLSSDRFIAQSRTDMQRKIGAPELLTAGHRKDYVVGINNLRPDRTSIYGWFDDHGNAIQGPGVQASFHESSYADYSHGARIVFAYVRVGDDFMPYADALRDGLLGAASTCWRHPFVKAPTEA